MKGFHPFTLLSLLPAPSREKSSALIHKDRTPHPALHYLSPLEKARQALADGAYAQALSQFSLLIQDQPHDNWAWHGRGDAFQLMGAYPQAEIAYTKAHTLQPKEGIHLAGKANALLAQERMDEGEKAWRDALTLDPSLDWMRNHHSS